MVNEWLAVASQVLAAARISTCASALEALPGRNEPSRLQLRWYSLTAKLPSSRTDQGVTTNFLVFAGTAFTRPMRLAVLATTAGREDS